MGAAIDITCHIVSDAPGTGQDPVAFIGHMTTLIGMVVTMLGLIGTALRDRLDGLAFVALSSQVVQKGLIQVTIREPGPSWAEVAR